MTVWCCLRAAARKDRTADDGERFFRTRARTDVRAQRKEMVDRKDPLPVTRQCALLEQNPNRHRSSAERFGARRRERLMTRSCCFISRLSATAFAPPGPRSLAIVVSRWRSSSRFFMAVQGRGRCNQGQDYPNHRFRGENYEFASDRDRQPKLRIRQRHGYSAIHDGISRWPCRTRQTSIWSLCST